MALLVVRLLGWSVHLETGRDEPKADGRPDMRGSVTTEAMDPGTPDHPALGFTPPGTRGIGWED